MRSPIRPNLYALRQLKWNPLSRGSFGVWNKTRTLAGQDLRFSWSSHFLLEFPREFLPIACSQTLQPKQVKVFQAFYGDHSYEYDPTAVTLATLLRGLRKASRQPCRMNRTEVFPSLEVQGLRDPTITAPSFHDRSPKGTASWDLCTRLIKYSEREVTKAPAA